MLTPTSTLRTFISVSLLLLTACHQKSADDRDRDAEIQRLKNELDKTKLQLAESGGNPAERLFRTASDGFAKADYPIARTACERILTEYPQSPFAKKASDLLMKIDAAMKLSTAKPDLVLGINELWSQRFEDNKFRAKQRLDDKTIRVTGALENISETSFSLSGNSNRFGRVSLVVNLNSAYSTKIQGGLAALERGTMVTVQGIFSFEKMCLNDGVFVDRSTGTILFSDDLKTFSKTEGAMIPAPAGKDTR